MLKIICAIFSFFYSLLCTVGIAPKCFYPAPVFLSCISKEEADFVNDKFTVDIDNGTFSVAKGDVTLMKNVRSGYKLGDDMVYSTDYSEFNVSKEQISDACGNSTKITVSMAGDGLPDAVQTFSFYDGADYFLTDLTLTAKSGEVATNYIAPIIITDKNLQNGRPRWTNFLKVPFDNDGWVKFETSNLYSSGISHEVGAFFTPDNADGLILGSVTHDTWKTAVEYENGFGCIKNLRVYGGANTELTRDQSPHGTVHGKSVSSPVIFVGSYDHWKDGMNEFARVNTTFQPKRKAVGSSTPIGWNSWGSMQGDISYNAVCGISDYIRDNYQSVWQESDDEAVYINLDSCWDFLSDEELRNFVLHCEANGQEAGIYCGPFILWPWSDLDRCVKGTDVKYRDIVLKKSDGTMYSNDLDGALPLDPTHPATLIHAKNQIERFTKLGFKYIKLDFLVHASLEGEHYNKDIQTGIEAYNYGMTKVTEMLGDDMFINLAMSPTFPYHYANGRRLACDSYYEIGNTQYTLNALTYGFWENELYDYTDPDHIVLWGKEGKAKEQEARSRMISGVISGTSLLAGDNFVSLAGDSDKAKARIDSLLGNKDLIKVAKIGEPFIGDISAKCPYASNVFRLENDGKLYIAVINYNKTLRINSVKLDGKYTAKNLFTGEEKNVNKLLTVSLDGRDGVIYELTPR